jgi:hypothetical protein
MPTVIATHEVKDSAHWLASPKRAEVMGQLGITNIRTFVDPQNPNRVALSAEVPDVDALMAAMQSPEFGEAMQHDGVLPETVSFFIAS